jgi:hypothetical protein
VTAYLTVTEAASRIGVAPRQLRRYLDRWPHLWPRSSRLHPGAWWRLHPEDVAAWVARAKRPWPDEGGAT